jgi:hypothetical protein
MKAATLHDIKQELIQLPPSKLTDICLRLARFKKENKELISYLLFEAGDENGYVQSVKIEIDELFETVNKTNVYLAKKTLRKILRTTNKHIRYMASKPAETELLIYFCQKLQSSGLPLHKNTVLANLYKNQVAKAGKLITGLHEDLQHDFEVQLKTL